MSVKYADWNFNVLVATGAPSDIARAKISSELYGQQREILRGIRCAASMNGSIFKVLDLIEKLSESME